MGRRRSRWPASVSTSLPSTRICTLVDGRQIRRQRADERIHSKGFVCRPAGVIGLHVGAQINIDFTGLGKKERSQLSACRYGRHAALGRGRNLRFDDPAGLLGCALAKEDFLLDALQSGALLVDIEKPRADLARLRRGRRDRLRLIGYGRQPAWPEHEQRDEPGHEHGGKPDVEPESARHLLLHGAAGGCGSCST